MTAPAQLSTSEVASKGERTRHALLEGAIRRFAADGFRATSVSGIARDAGLTPAAAYAYFDGKEALFAAAVDADAAGLIGKALGPVLSGTFDTEWQALIGALVQGMEEHPLARRILSGREPEHTERLLSIPALTELEVGIAARLAAGQEAGEVRPDVNTALIASGLVTTVMSILIAVLQTGIPVNSERADGVAALLASALVPVRPG